MAGRPRKPTELLELSGAFDHDPNRRRPLGPKSDRAIGGPPEHLSPSEAQAWREVVADHPPGVLTSADRPVLEALSTLIAKMRHEGLTGSEWGHLRGFLVEIGATPASRSKIAGAPADAEAPSNPWDVPAPNAPGSRAAC